MRIGRPLQLYEALYLAIGVTVTISAPLRNAGWETSAVAASCTAAYAIFLKLSRVGGVARVVGAYLATWVLYSGSSRLVENLHLAVRSKEILAADEWLFGQSPAMALQGHLSILGVELLALGYMSYHVYLHWVLIDALFRNDAWRAALSARIFLAFGVGFMGYLTFPASSPATAFPELFHQPLPGGVFAQFNDTINASLAARYDAFPSLHTLITLILLQWDWAHWRTRFWIMLGPSLLMLAATLALRLHYAVDLIASGTLFVMLMILHARLSRTDTQPLGA
jgi:hypothetical protein